MKNLRKSSPLRILFTAAEATPYVKVGGLADVTGSLPSALLKVAGQTTPLDIRLAIPLHPAIRLQDYQLDSDPIQFSVPHPKGPVPALAWTTSWNGVKVYLIDGEPIQSQKTVYSIDTRLDGQKYTFFSLAVLELCHNLAWYPHVLHAHDWHTGIAVHMLPIRKSADANWLTTKSVFTVHNLPYMGAGTDQALREYAIPLSGDTRLPGWGNNQPLPMALAAADFITAVSPGYAREIMTPEFGCGLEDFLRLRSGEVAGVLNGLDLEANDPAHDSDIVQSFDRTTLNERRHNKLALQKEADFREDAEIPLLILISRFDFQKGIDLAVRAVNSLLKQYDFQVLFLGSGNPEIELSALELEAARPDNVRVKVEFNARLARRMYAGGDMLLIPSRYEPCGLTQMLAMRYGCVPIARATGGLRDTILDAADPGNATGFLFEEATSASLAGAIERALVTFHEPVRWLKLQNNGMEQDFSWDRSARQYLDIYHSLISSSQE